MRYLAFLGVVFLVLPPAAATASGAQQQRRATGSSTFAILVSDPAGQPLTGVKVTLDGPAQRSQTTEAGRIAFENLPAGTYHVRFERDGFETLDRDVVARGARPIDVKVTLVPAPKPVPLPPPPPPAAPTVDAKAVVLDMPALIEKNYVGRASGKVSSLACAAGGDATLIQINDPLTDQRHADADEFVYVIAGQGTARLGEREETLRAGMFVLIPRGLPHTLTRSGRSPLVMLAMRAGEHCAQ